MKQLLLSLPPYHGTGCGQKFLKLNLVGFWARACVLTVMLLLPAGCGVHKKMTVVGAAALMEDVAKASYKQSDLRLVREGMPAYLMLMDGMVEGWPDNERLLLAAAQAYASYATAFVGADDTAFRDVLLLRAKTYALQALVQRGISAPLTAPFAEFERRVGQTTRSDVPYVFWSASCWGNWIAAHANSIAAVAELPRVEALIRRSLTLDETYYYGGPHIFMGVLYASRPQVAGGSLELSKQHFLKAIEIGQGKFLMAYVYYADYYARKAFYQELYVSVLNKVLETPADTVPELTLLNTVARHKAEALLGKTDEYF
ncbi:MAG: hypothetical protein HY895_07130 [Deltaproteobacteria bacterium]|nr:hypothetical protein [Deltaproteobacteria bacterium]